MGQQTVTLNIDPTNPNPQPNPTQVNPPVNNPAPAPAPVQNPAPAPANPQPQQQQQPQPQPQQTNQPQQQQQQPQQTYDNPLAVKIDEAQKLINSKGLNFDVLRNEYESNGVLSANTYEQLDKAGFSRAVVDTFIRGIEADGDRLVSEVYAAVGGQKEYESIQQYVATQDKATVDGFNQMINSGNVFAIKMMLNGIKSQMQTQQIQRNGTNAPSVLGGQNVAAPGFASVDDYFKAIKDARYGQDTNYTNDVINKLQSSGLVQFKRR